MTGECGTARDRIARIDLRVWHGLPTECRPADLFPQLSNDTSGWAQRPLGEDFNRASFAVLDIPGYYRPTVSVRNGVVVLFDGMNPTLAGGFAALSSELGRPADTLDYSHGTLPVPQGEWVYPSRGITVFVNTTADRTLHVALYSVTSIDDYRHLLRPHLGKTLRPRPVADELG